ncbi:MAG: 2-oxoacid:ferredoxin oxidoreductase subunit gamma [Calditrichaeota bacterium]|nr:2-oxoacid:ferredoxin oxidoreductase subunit gamma [Calditrichota bacterium]
MQIEVKFAGFGGQGVLSAGKFLAEAGLREGKEVGWIPSYGPEMRGGTAYCDVVISDRSIGSPIINSPAHLVAMNRPSLEKFAPKVRPKGIIVINSSLIPITSNRSDLTELLIPCNEIAIELGNPKGANMVALGAYVACSKVVTLEVLEAVIRHEFERKPAFIDANIAALRRGAELVRTKAEIHT